ncbi:MAG: RibD family protein [Verrucomicrobia bacterium]|nr:RibD family protein [Verrucomicrobiota bacterium]
MATRCCCSEAPTRSRGKGKTGRARQPTTARVTDAPRPGAQAPVAPAIRVLPAKPLGPVPFVLVNMAMTADGKIATANGAVASFGSARDRAHLYELRATADAVMCGARTVAAGPILLGPGPAKYRRLRVRRRLAEYNLRVIVSGTGSLPASAAVFQKRFSPIVILTTERAGLATLRRWAQVADEVLVCGRREIDFPRALAWLRKRWQVRRLLCEGGGELNGALFAAGLVNELHLTICPWLLGGRRALTIADGVGVERLADATQLELKRRRRIGAELFCVYKVRAAGHET